MDNINLPFTTQKDSSNKDDQASNHRSNEDVFGHQTDDNFSVNVYFEKGEAVLVIVQYGPIQFLM